MNPDCEGEVKIEVLPDCTACAEMSAAPIKLEIEYGLPIIAPCLEAIRFQQSLSDHIAQRYGIPRTLADDAGQSNYSGLQLERDILDRQLGIERGSNGHSSN